MIESPCAVRLAAEEQEHPVLPAAPAPTIPGCHARWFMARSKQKPQAKADLFDQALLEASEPDLQDLVENAPRWFADQPLELLREYKFRVDTRLGAEPDTKVFYRDDPHEVRVRYWHRIADRLGAEINLRSSRKARNCQEVMTEKPRSAGAPKD